MRVTVAGEPTKSIVLAKHSASAVFKVVKSRLHMRVSTIVSITRSPCLAIKRPQERGKYLQDKAAALDHLPHIFAMFPLFLLLASVGSTPSSIIPYRCRWSERVLDEERLDEKLS